MNIKVKNNSSLDDVVILRCIAIVSMVMWHCHCSYICWELTDTPMDKWYSLVYKTLIPDADLPLFTFLSGYLFCYLSQKGGYGNFRLFVLNKSKRLLIPYFIVGTIINLTAPQRYVSDIVWGNSCHLWYCLMLFWCFILCWCVIWVNNRFLTYGMLLISICYVIWRGSVWNYPGFRLLLGLLHTVYYYCYFFIGYLVFKHKSSLYCYMKICFWPVVILFISMCNPHFVTPYRILNNSFFFIRICCFILILWSIVNFFLSRGGSVNKLVFDISKYSFGIFIFHEWIAWDLCHIPYVISIMNEHYILFPILFSILNFIVSFYLTKWSLKTKIGQFLIG